MTITLLQQKKAEENNPRREGEEEGDDEDDDDEDDDDDRREKGRGFLSSVSEQNNVQSQASHPQYHPLMGMEVEFP